MRNRRRQWAAFSLFSFQDIVTSVMGIVTLIVMVSAIELVSRSLESPAVQNRMVRIDLEAAIVAASAQLARLRKAIAAGGWDDLAKLSPADIDRESAALGQLLPTLQRDLKSAQQRLAQAQQRRNKAAAALAARTSDQERLDRLKQELASLEQELARITSASALFYRPSETGGKQAWMVQISGQEIRAARLGPKGPATVFAGSTADSRKNQFLAWARDRAAEREYFVLLIQPSGVEVSRKIQEELRQRGFGVGLDLIGAKQTAVDVEQGAPLGDSQSGAPAS